MRFIEKFVDGLSSIWLSCVLLLLLGLLTWLGTLEQVHTGLFEVQRKYFDSIFLIHRAGPLAIPLPGAALVMGVLFVNLLLGGILRMRKDASTWGILVTHVGILMLIVAGYVKFAFAEDGHVTLYEGQRSNTFESYHHWEVAVSEPLPSGELREVVSKQEFFENAVPGAEARLSSGELPFDIEVTRFVPNCRVLPKGPMVSPAVPVVEGFFLDEQPKEAQNESNIAGAYIALVERSSGARKEALLWGASRDPWTVEIGGRKFGIELRREQWVMPFTVALEDFEKEDHPRMMMPKSFSSDVVVTEGGATRQVKISMNEPLRQKGLVLYQASWGPSNARPGDPLFSTLAVVRNPADQYPLYSCIVIAIGLVLHFGRKLFKHIRAEALRNASTTGQAQQAS
ncbi:MAG: cytochrome c biogenesis protein ResB [Planctomycetaceae bacterium]|nr:cytochrome c biogenesis protein ResB [Planctomycetaceae bacterium]